MDSSSLWCCKSIPWRDAFNLRGLSKQRLRLQRSPSTSSILRQPSVYRTEADPQGPCDHIGPFASLNATHCANAHRFQRRMIQLASIVFSHATLEIRRDIRRVNKNMKLLMDGLISVAYTGNPQSRPVYRCDKPNLMMGLPRCMTFGGPRVDSAIARELLRAVEPMAIEAALEAERMHREQQEEQQRILDMELAAGAI